MALRLITGTSTANTIRGLSVAEEILGLAGNDQLYGGGGDDLVNGGSGNDVLVGDDGNDVLIDSDGIDSFTGGAGFDTIDYSGTTDRGVDVFLSLGIGGRSALGDTYNSMENVTGTKFQDFLWGNAENNVLDGGDGNDFLRGFDGADTLIGGRGNDELYGDAGGDVFRPGSGQDIVIGGAGTDWVDMSGETNGMKVNFGTNTFSGSLSVWGTTEGDQLYVEGLTATNFDDDINLNGQVGWSFTIVNGADGNDTLEGAQSYLGGQGEDSIRLSSARAEYIHLQNDMGYDKITSFNSANGDRLVVNKAMFGLDSNATPVFQWVDNLDEPRATTTQASFIYEKSTQILWFDGDGTNTAKAPIAIAGFYSLAGVDASGAQLHPVQSDFILY